MGLSIQGRKWVRKEILCFSSDLSFYIQGKRSPETTSLSHKTPQAVPEAEPRLNPGSPGSWIWSFPWPPAWARSDQWPWCYKRLWSSTIQCLSTRHLAPTFVMWLAENTALVIWASQEWKIPGQWTTLPPGILLTQPCLQRLPGPLPHQQLIFHSVRLEGTKNTHEAGLEGPKVGADGIWCSS